MCMYVYIYICMQYVLGKWLVMSTSMFIYGRIQIDMSLQRSLFIYIPCFWAPVKLVKIYQKTYRISWNFMGFHHAKRTRIQAAPPLDLLPWKRCGISCSSLSISQIMASSWCLGMWARRTPAQKRSSHPVTRRFHDTSISHCPIGHQVDLI